MPGLGADMVTPHSWAAASTQRRPPFRVLSPQTPTVASVMPTPRLEFPAQSGLLTEETEGAR